MSEEKYVIERELKIKKQSNILKKKIYLRYSPEQIYYRNNDKNNVNIPSTATIYRMILVKRIPKVEMIHLEKIITSEKVKFVL